jgi:three-Cys-motif partner protein
MSKKHESELLANKIKSLIVEDNGEDSESLNKGHPWSVAKLLLLGQWADVYSTIIKDYFDSYRFVDLLAGAGRTRIEETQSKLIKGSVFVVDTFAQKYPFAKYMLVENDFEKYNALKQRTSILGERCEVIQEDCNKVVEQIFADYADHNLVFIDNQGFNVNWKSIEAIMRSKADVIINYPTSMFERVARDPKSSGKLRDFFGDDSWQLAKFDRKYSAKIYMDNLRRDYEKIKKKLTTKNIQAYVNNIRLGTKSFFYDIILVCKKGDYTNVWEQMKQKWNEKNCRCLIDFINGKTPCLDVFEGFSREVSELDKKHRQRNKPYNKNNTVKLERFFEN